MVPGGSCAGAAVIGTGIMGAVYDDGRGCGCWVRVRSGQGQG